MTREKRRLGQGLAALLGTSFEERKEEAAEQEPETLRIYPDAVAGDPASSAPSEDDENLRLNVYEIDNNPFQPRREFSEPEIASLAESL